MKVEPFDIAPSARRRFYRLELGIVAFSAVVALIAPTLLFAGYHDKSAVLANCKLKAMEMYRLRGEL
jgi:hypothetical protein